MSHTSTVKRTSCTCLTELFFDNEQSIGVAKQHITTEIFKDVSHQRGITLSKRDNVIIRDFRALLIDIARIGDLPLLQYSSWLDMKNQDGNNLSQFKINPTLT